MPVVRAGRGEVRDDVPVGPAVALGDLEVQRRYVTDDRGGGEPQPLAGQPGGLPQRLVAHGLRVHGAGGAADGEPLGRPHGGRSGVEGLPGDGFGDPAAQPARLAAPTAGPGVATGYVQDDLAGAVEAAGAVPVHLAGGPAVLGPRLPDQRGLPGIDTDTVDAAVEGQRHGAVRHGRSEPEHQAVTGLRRLGEAEQVLALGQLVRTVDGGLAGAVDHQVGQLAGENGEFALGGEDDGLLALRTGGGDLCAHGQPYRIFQRRRQPEGDVGARGRRREEGDADQVEEGEVVLLGDAVEPVDDLVGHVGDRFDERDPGVGHVVVRPLRGALLDVALGVIHELLEAAVVEVGRGQCHQRSLSVAGPASEDGSSWEGMT